MTHKVWHLAQINIGRMLAAKGDAQVAGFYAELDRVNALADHSPGFVWRLQDESGNASGFQETPDPLTLINMSVWTDAESLFAFVYRSAHTPVMAQRRQWLERYEGAFQALWWVSAGEIPTVADGLSRLWLLDRFGPSPRAFTFKQRYPVPGLPGLPADMQPDPWCAGSA